MNKSLNNINNNTKLPVRIKVANKLFRIQQGKHPKYRIDVYEQIDIGYYTYQFSGKDVNHIKQNLKKFYKLD